MKACVGCGETKPYSEFGKEKRNRDGYAGRCYACERARSAERRKDPTRKAYVAEWMRAKRENPEVKERGRQYTAEYRVKNPEKVRAALEKWRVDNVAQVRAYNGTQRAMRRQAVPGWMTPEHLKQIAAVYTAAHELTDATGVKHVVDHIVPLKNKEVCGLHVWWNLRAIPESENARKKNRFDVAQYPEQGELNQIKEVCHGGV